MYNNDAIRWQMPDFLSDGNSNVCSLSHRLQDIKFFFQIGDTHTRTHARTHAHTHTHTHTDRGSD